MAAAKRTLKASKPKADTLAGATAAAAAVIPAEHPPQLLRRGDKAKKVPSATPTPSAVKASDAASRAPTKGDSDESKASPSPGCPVFMVLIVVAAAAAALAVVGGWMPPSAAAGAPPPDGHCCRMDKDAVTSQAARRICAQAQQKAADLPVFLRRLLVGSPAQRAETAADIRRGLGRSTTWLEVGGQSVPELIRGLEAFDVAACCVVLWVPDALKLRPDTTDVFKSLVETGGIGGRRLLRARTTLLVGAAADDDLSEKLPDRLVHLLTRVEL